MAILTRPVCSSVCRLGQHRLSNYKMHNNSDMLIKTLLYTVKHTTLEEFKNVRKEATLYFEVVAKRLLYITAHDLAVHK